MRRRRRYTPELGRVSSQRQSRFKRAARSLASFIRLHRSICSSAFRFAMLARSIDGLAHSLRSLLRGTVKFINVFTL